MRANGGAFSAKEQKFSNLKSLRITYWPYFFSVLECDTLHLFSVRVGSSYASI